MEFDREEMIQAVDQAIEAFKESMGTPKSITIHPKTSKHIFGDLNYYCEVELIKDELCPEETFYVNSGIEEL